ncbi:MAG: molybdate ABC transporter permease subunit [Microcoleus sp. PH2017_25_DOB_D_A]|uniref:molybdate ABC transporter permease subunit n=1 Tax=unclassified Microcoleus TaxID=2642155 RepID=UPI001E05D4F3|nr:MULTISPECIES: molybdate ABC transporter permease subunit [unclassified Microcoleus]MCC3536255.1 molybdate ABC transporter permease subunit [Microcoleus sp. PH2017_25_DOB_D_A]MCC3548052.1 molybdate ABC transporter permease subunit [Microcoleus sp. PH2017_24_DOB_U_A]TAE42815.1 MAG: molybdate ABC transporter permease subunit [Oscillatoriales cyanobacterium]
MEFDLSPLWISLKASAIATFLTFFLGIAAARWMLSTRIRGKALIEGIFISPLVLPPTVVGFLLLLLFGRNGAIGQLLLKFDLTILFTCQAAVITATVVSFPLMYKTALGSFEQIDANLLNAARTLGASEWTVFWRIMLPLAWPGILAGTILAFARALGEFGATLMLAGNIPGQTQTIPMAIYFAVEAGDMRQAAIWVLIVLSLALTMLTAVNYWTDLQKKSPQPNPHYTNPKSATKLVQAYPLDGQDAHPTILDGQDAHPTTHLGLGYKWDGQDAHPTTYLGLPYKRQSHIPKNAPNLTPKYPTKQSQSGLFLNIFKPLSGFALNVGFDIGPEVLGILGASGSGKSMTLRCIAGLETPTSGKIAVNGKVLFDSVQGINVPSKDRRIGFLFQNYALFPHLTVAENIAFGLQHLSTSEQQLRVKEQLISVQMSGLENRYPQELSGGQQQRVALARAIASSPDLLLLDEPFSALDTHLRSQLERELMQALANYRGITLFVSHNLEEVYRVCENLLVLADGSAIAFDTKQNIFDRPRNFTVAQLTGCKNFCAAKPISETVVEAIDWRCDLTVAEPIPKSLVSVGIRAHQISFVSAARDRENTFACWIASTVETPHRVTLYLKLHSPPHDSQDYHLQAEVFKEKWRAIKDNPFPWYVHLEPIRLILMEA